MTRTGSRGGTLTSVRIGVLGPVDGPDGLSGLRLRGLLARLALDAGRPGRLPRGALGSLEAAAARLRPLGGDDVCG